MCPHTVLSPLCQHCTHILLVIKNCFKQSGIIPLLDEDIAVMVDKGFTIDDLVPGKVHTPPFLGKNSQLSREDVLAENTRGESD